MKLSQKHPKELSDYFHTFNSDNIQYYESLNYFLDKIKNIPGCIIECGIGRGRSLVAISHLIFKLNIKKNFYALDSFEGFDFISDYDKSFRNPKKGQWSKSPNQKISYNIKFIKKVLKFHLHKKNKINIEFIKGYVEKTLPKLKKKIHKISFINCDVDLYNGHKAVLENLWNKLSVNGIIYFDDVYFKDKKRLAFPGAKKAVIDFFKTKKNYKKLICPFRKILVIIKTY